MSQAWYGKVPKALPHVRPALLMSISSLSVLDLISSIKILMSVSDDKSPAKPSARPASFRALISAAVASQAPPLRLVIKTFAPAVASPVAAMRPIPVAPPVITAILPLRPKR